MIDFGISRVLEPKGSIPVAAWKLDNSKKIRSGEIRISLEWIDLERDNMDQLVLSNDYWLCFIGTCLFNEVTISG